METDDEEEQVHARADHRDFTQAGGLSATAEVCRRHVISEQTFYRWRVASRRRAPNPG
jgi:transposase-like protein